VPPQALFNWQVLQRLLPPGQWRSSTHTQAGCTGKRSTHEHGSSAVRCTCQQLVCHFRPQHLARCPLSTPLHDHKKPMSSAPTWFPCCRPVVQAWYTSNTEQEVISSQPMQAHDCTVMPVRKMDMQVHGGAIAVATPHLVSCSTASHAHPPTWRQPCRSTAAPPACPSTKATQAVLGAATGQHHRQLCTTGAH
jgi:hypothetical protein